MRCGCEHGCVHSLAEHARSTLPRKVLPVRTLQPPTRTEVAAAAATAAAVCDRTSECTRKHTHTHASKGQNPLAIEKAETPCANLDDESSMALLFILCLLLSRPLSAQNTKHETRNVKTRNTKQTRNTKHETQNTKHKHKHKHKHKQTKNKKTQNTKHKHKQTKNKKQKTKNASFKEEKVTTLTSRTHKQFCTHRSSRACLAASTALARLSAALPLPPPLPNMMRNHSNKNERMQAKKKNNKKTPADFPFLESAGTVMRSLRRTMSAVVWRRMAATHGNVFMCVRV